ncbi:MAG: hypothetical protein ACP5G2_06670 [Candidatus Bipolaricaulaceae bacterium]
MRAAWTTAAALLVAMGASGGQLVDLSGTWAMVQVFPQIAVLPLIGQVQRTSVVGALVHVQQEGCTVTMIDYPCFTLVDHGSALVEVEFPEAFIRSLIPPVRTATLTQLPDGIRFDQPTCTEVRGAILDDPANDPLPTDAHDEQGLDQDRDGRPGMTVHITILGALSGEAYVVQRIRYSLTGWLIGADRVEGLIDWTIEQTLLGTTNPLFRTDALDSPHPDPARHRFVMVRAGPAWDCETTRARLREILGPDH